MNDIAFSSKIGFCHREKVASLQCSFLIKPLPDSHCILLFQRVSYGRMCANPVSCQFRSVGHDEQHFQNIQVIFKLNKSFVWPNLVEIFCAQVTEI